MPADTPPPVEDRYHALYSKCRLTHAEHHYPRTLATQIPEFGIQTLEGSIPYSEDPASDQRDPVFRALSDPQGVFDTPPGDRFNGEVEHPSSASIEEIAAGLAEIGTGGTPAFIRGYNRGYDDALEHYGVDPAGQREPVGEALDPREMYAAKVIESARTILNEYGTGRFDSDTWIALRVQLEGYDRAALRAAANPEPYDEPLRFGDHNEDAVIDAAAAVIRLRFGMWNGVASDPEFSIQSAAMDVVAAVLDALRAAANPEREEER